jgi:hypothetical protein
MFGSLLIGGLLYSFFHKCPTCPEVPTVRVAENKPASAFDLLENRPSQTIVSVQRLEGNTYGAFYIYKLRYENTEYVFFADSHIKQWHLLEKNEIQETK